MNREAPPAHELNLRLEAVRARVATDVLVVHGRPNVQYLTGYDGAGFTPWLILDGQQQRLVHYTADEDTFRAWASTWELLSFGPADDELERVVEALPRDRQIVYGGDVGWWGADEFVRLKVELGDGLRSCSRAFGTVRRRKTSWEQAQLRAAGAITEKVMAHLVELAEHGATGRELAAELHALAIRLGSGPLPPTPFIAVGAATLANHATWDMGSEAAESFLFEFATSQNGYGVPLTTSNTTSAPGRRALRAISQGLQRIDERMRPTMPAAEVDQLMRSSIAEAGFELRHRSGYSIGLGEADTWMEGRVARLSPNADYPLEPGMAFHVVGSVVSRGAFGVGQSMSVLVTESGIEHLAGPISGGGS